MERILALLGIRSVFTSARTLKRTLMKVKSRLPDDKRRGVVYQIPCNNCDHVYTGESKRTLKIRMVEHRRAVQKSDPYNGIAVHVAKSHHSIDWKKARAVKSVQGTGNKELWKPSRSRRARVPINLRRQGLTYISPQSGTRCLTEPDLLSHTLFVVAHVLLAFSPFILVTA